jgi:osmotically-inducible protein OsmY
MPHRDRFPPERDHPRDRDWDRRELREDNDFGQADYSTDYAYDPRSRTGYRAHDERDDLRDYGQADYSEDFAYDARNRTGYRRSDPEVRRVHEEGYYDGPRDLRRDYDYDDRRDVRRAYDYDDPREQRSFMDQARDFFGVSAYNERRDDRRHRHGRVIWAVINGRFDHERGLDPRDIEVIVDGTEVTLNGIVRSREEKRLAEDLADVRGVTHIQNNLRVGRRGFWR